MITPLFFITVLFLYWYLNRWLNQSLESKVNAPKVSEGKPFNATGQYEKGISEAGASLAGTDIHLSTGSASK